MTFGKSLATIIACGAIATSVVAAIPTQAFTGEELAPAAKVTLTEARATALKAFPGEIASEELEKERGGSGLRYSFDIKNGTVVHEIGVDAKTGRILENNVERAGNH